MSGCVLRYSGQTAARTHGALEVLDDALDDLGASRVGDWAVELQAYVPHVLNTDQVYDPEASARVAKSLWVLGPLGNSASTSGESWASAEKWVVLDSVDGSALGGSASLQTMVESLRAYREAQYFTMKGRVSRLGPVLVRVAGSYLHAKGDQQLVGVVVTVDAATDRDVVRVTETLRDAMGEDGDRLEAVEPRQEALKGRAKTEPGVRAACLATAHGAFLARFIATQGQPHADGGVQ